MLEFFAWCAFGAIILIVITATISSNDERTDGNGFTAFDRAIHGTASPNMVCPHCQTKGKTLVRQVVKKGGISGGKFTGALLTGGVSLLVTGLSRKNAQTELFARYAQTRGTSSRNRLFHIFATSTNRRVGGFAPFSRGFTRR